MSSIKAVLRKKPNKQGLFPIAIRITKNRKSSYLYIGQYIDEKFWDKANHKVKKSHPNSTRLNHLIATELAEANKSLLESQAEDRTESAQHVKSKIIKADQCDFFAASQIHLNALQDRKKFSQYDADNARLNIFKAFLGKATLPFQDITTTLLNKFQLHLLYEKKRSPRTVANYMILIRLIYNLAITEELTHGKNYPFGKGKIQIKIPESEKIGLTRDEVIKLETVTELTPAQTHARNIWLFSFYFAGIRVADVLKLRWNDFRDGRLYYRMGKNEKLVSLKIPAKAQAILDLYAKNKRQNNGLVFHYLTNTDFNNEKEVAVRVKTSTRTINRRLKLVAEKAGITKKLSMHIARHSFGNISGDTIPIQMLQKLYRHSSITTTVNYQQNFMHKETDEALDKVIGF